MEHALYFSAQCDSISRATPPRLSSTLAAPGHLWLYARSSAPVRPLETVAAGARGSARAIARAGEWSKNSRARHERRIARGRHAGRRRRAGANHRRRGGAKGRSPMKYIFITGGVVSSLGKGLAAASLGTLLELRGLRVVLQKFDPVSERRSGHDEPVPARRSLRAERRRRDRSRPRPLRALHELRPLTAQQPHERSGLRDRDPERAARRLSRQDRAGDSARHR